MKPGIKTSEFLLAAVTIAGSIAGTLAGILDPKWAAVATSISTLAYSISRGLAKQA